MSVSSTRTIVRLLIGLLISAFLWPVGVFAAGGPATVVPPSQFLDEAPKPKSRDKKKKKKRKKKARKSRKNKRRIRWGQRRNESKEKYDKRYARMLKHIKQDKKGDFSGGVISKGGEKIRMWTYMGHPFIVRTDIDREFTAETAMYMEMLHREYGAAYKKFLGIKPDLKTPVEVIVFADRKTYMENGGSPGSGGFFMSFARLKNDRLPSWKARDYRLQQFTGGIREFSKWPKGTLKHEAAHMELQLRLGMKGDPRFGGLGLPIDCPRWFNEGHASVFEYWNFDKSVDENIAKIPDRGRYAPVIRRIYETDKWKEFDYVWKIDPASWHKDMTSQQGFLNYAQAWSLCAYMMTGGVKGRKDFRAVFDLSARVGVDRQQTWKGDGMRAWALAFSEEDQSRLEKNWESWVGSNVSRDEAVKDEEFFLRRMRYDPDVVDKLVPITDEDEIKENTKWVERETKKRKKSKRVEK